MRGDGADAMMVASRPGLAGAMLIGLLCGPASAAEPPAPQLIPQKPVAPGVAAFPRLAGIADDRAAQRINHALAQADARVRDAARSCPRGAGKDGWQRSIFVTMPGPLFLGFLAHDEWDCGAYPSSTEMALVYDLRTGAPVNWARLLPPLLVQNTGTDMAGDGTVIGTITAPALATLYRQMAEGQKLVDAECRDALASPDMAFTLWPDAAAGGLVIEPESLPHALAACGPDVTIPIARLRELGTAPALLDAIGTAWQDRHGRSRTETP